MGTNATTTADAVTAHLEAAHTPHPSALAYLKQYAHALSIASAVATTIQPSNGSLTRACLPDFPQLRLECCGQPCGCGWDIALL